MISCSLKADNTIACWGSDEEERVSGAASGVFTQIEAGGGIVCWGKNDKVQILPPF